MTEINQILQKNYRDADRLMLWILWGLFVMSLALSGLHDTMKWALLIGLPAVLLPTALIIMASGARVTRLVVAAMLMVMAGLHIHQAAGMTELHFGIFVLLAFLLCYRDWSVILTAATVIAVHHLSFDYLQELGWGVLCLTKPGFGMVLIHAAYVVAESAVLSYLAVLLHREALQAAELRSTVSGLTGNGSGSIDLSMVHEVATSESGIALHGAVRILSTAMGEVQTGMDTMVAVSGEIADGNYNLSLQTSHQAKALANTAASMLELTTTVKDNAENARQANQLAGSATRVAVKGGAVVARVVHTMGSINESARKIVDIIDVIDGIAFQTNILALNAAVEAARAGEQGRGFAVVAAEVRNLAQRSAAAAREIKTLISDSVEKVEAGSKLVSEAGMTMDEIGASVKSVTDIIAAISAASVEQSNGIEQVNRVIGEVEEMTRQNAALVEDASTAAAAMQQQAGQVASAIAMFTIATTTPHSRNAPATPMLPSLATVPASALAA